MRKRTIYMKIKRIIDFIMASIGFIVLSPIFLIIMLAIKVDSPGPVFFKQKRLGLHKKYFDILKFRTMKINTPKDVPTHLLENPEQYITKVGRILRKTSLDELPQLFNIIKGEMSIIGPRPALWNQFDLVEERDKYGANDVMPGLTGWAQINGRDELEISTKAKLDGMYLENIGFRMDIKCFVKTIFYVLRSDGIIEGRNTGTQISNRALTIKENLMDMKLMYITNSVEIAKIAQKAGVDRIWIDLEYIGKDERQAGMDTVKSHHTIEDIKKLRPVIKESELMVRVNPIHEESEEEINATIEAGADLIMLPMFKTVDEVRKFLRIVAKRAKTILLVETKEAVEDIHHILQLDGIDEVHLGLNDLHLSYGRKFMFELLADGTVEKIVNEIRKYGYRYGFGGVARVGYGLLPAEMILREHCRLKSEMVILSRSFCDTSHLTDSKEIEQLFFIEIKKLRQEERDASLLNANQLEENRKALCEKVQEIVEKWESGTIIQHDM